MIKLIILIILVCISIVNTSIISSNKCKWYNPIIEFIINLIILAYGIYSSELIIVILYSITILIAISHLLTITSKKLEEITWFKS